MILRLGCGLFIASAMGRPLGAQRARVGASVQSTVIDAGLTVAHFRDDSTTVAGPSVQLSTAGVRGPYFASANVGGLLTAGAASGYGALRAGARWALGGPLLWELGGEASSVIGSSRAGATGGGLASARVLWARGAMGSWLGASGHAAQRPNSTPVGHGVDAGAWWSLPKAQMTLTIAQEWSSAELYTGRLRKGFAGTMPVRYTEGAFGLRWESDRTALDVSAGMRRDEDAERLYEPMLGATLARWTSERHALVISISRQLPDFVHGADAADMISLGVRLRQPAPVARRLERIVAVIQVTDSGAVRLVRVRANGASFVEVMGDFSDWAPLSLSPNGGLFERAIPISAGSHHLVVRVNGGPWRPAANTPAVDDDLGGKSGLLVVP